MSKVSVSQRFKRFIANRILPVEIARQFDVLAPNTFRQPFPQDAPPGSGLAYKFSPYAQFYTKVYGVLPNADLTKYRLMYRTLPIVKSRIDKKLSLAVGKGFTIECDDPAGDKAAQFLEEWSRKVKLPKAMASVGSDMVVYGTGYLELVWSKMVNTQIEISPSSDQESQSVVRGPVRGWVEENTLCPKCHEHTLTGIRYTDNYTFFGDLNSFASYTCSNPECQSNPLESNSGPYRSELTAEAFMQKVREITNERFEGQTDGAQTIDYKAKDEGDQTNTVTQLKDLDPIYMRTRADAYGNVFGYYQWISFPPVLLGPSAVLCFRWNPHSWGYETIYGTSMLMPLIRYWDLLVQLENDLAVWVHTYAKPTVHLQAGTPERPYTDPQMKTLANAWKKRMQGADMLTKGDITSTVIETTVGRGNTLVEWLNYLLSRFKEELGIPDALMGQSGAQTGGSNRSTATVALEDVIVEGEQLQTALSEPFEQEVFPAVLRAEGFSDEECAYQYRVVWKPVFEEDPNTRSQRIVDQRKACIISINEARDQIPDMGSIDQSDTERYKPELDDPTFPPPAPPKQGGLNPETGINPEQPGHAAPGQLGPTSLTEPGGLAQNTGQYQMKKNVVSSF